MCVCVCACVCVCVCECELIHLIESLDICGVSNNCLLEVCFEVVLNVR